MVLQSRERKYIVKIGILIAVLLVAPSYVINSSDEFRRTESLRQNRLAQELASYVDRLARIEDERDLFRRFSDSYERLLDRGILNTPDRRSLLETASEIGRDRSFFEIGYRFDEPTEIVADQNRITEGSTIRVRIEPAGDADGDAPRSGHFHFPRGLPEPHQRETGADLLPLRAQNARLSGRQSAQFFLRVQHRSHIDH